MTEEKELDLAKDQKVLEMYSRATRSVIEALATVRNTPRGSWQYIKPGTYLSGEEIGRVFDLLAKKHRVVFVQRKLGSAVTVQVIADALESAANLKSA